jgi:hypothetical protein
MIGTQEVRLGWYRSKQTDRGRELSGLLLRHGNVRNPAEMEQREALSDGMLRGESGRGGFELNVEQFAKLAERLLHGHVQETILSR